MDYGEKRTNRRAPVLLRIKLRYPSVDRFIDKFATNISRGGMFISSRSPKPIGTQLRFELRLADNEPVIKGSGIVSWIREYDPNKPRRPYGMGIQFEDLNDSSQKLLERIIDERIARGLPDDDQIPLRPRANTRSDTAIPEALSSIPQNSEPIQVETSRHKIQSAEPQNLETQNLETQSPEPPLRIDNPSNGAWANESTETHSNQSSAAEVSSTDSVPPDRAQSIAQASPSILAGRTKPATIETEALNSDLESLLGRPVPEFSEVMFRARALVGSIGVGDDFDAQLNALLGSTSRNSKDIDTVVRAAAYTIASDSTREDNTTPFEHLETDIPIDEDLEVTDLKHQPYTEDLSADLDGGALDVDGLMASHLDQLTRPTSSYMDLDGKPDLSSFADPPGSDIIDPIATAIPVPIDDPNNDNEIELDAADLDELINELPVPPAPQPTQLDANQDLGEDEPPTAEDDPEKRPGFFKRIFGNK